jgi:hypothetical protein
MFSSLSQLFYLITNYFPLHPPRKHRHLLLKTLINTLEKRCIYEENFKDQVKPKNEQIIVDSTETYLPNSNIRDWHHSGNYFTVSVLLQTYN